MIVIFSATTVLATATIFSTAAALTFAAGFFIRICIRLRAFCVLFLLIFFLLLFRFCVFRVFVVPGAFHRFSFMMIGESRRRYQLRSTGDKTGHNGAKKFFVLHTIEYLITFLLSSRPKAWCRPVSQMFCV